MENIIEALNANAFNYEDIKLKSYLFLKNNNIEYDVNVIIGFRGRKEFLKPLTDSFALLREKVCI